MEIPKIHDLAASYQIPVREQVSQGPIQGHLHVCTQKEGGRSLVGRVSKMDQDPLDFSGKPA